MSEAMLDCAVVGGGPAGLSAAINLHQRGKSVRVLGAGAGLLAKAERVDNYLGLPGLSGSEMLAAFADHARSLASSRRRAGWPTCCPWATASC